MKRFYFWIIIAGSFGSGFSDPVDFQFQKCCPEHQVRSKITQKSPKNPKFSFRIKMILLVIFLNFLSGNTF